MLAASYEPGSECELACAACITLDSALHALRARLARLTLPSRKRTRRLQRNREPGNLDSPARCQAILPSFVRPSVDDLVALALEGRDNGPCVAIFSSLGSLSLEFAKVAKSLLNY